jgi:Holliday junction resolvase-like predicted endonuclease
VECFLKISILGGILLKSLFTLFFLLLSSIAHVFAGGKDIRLSGTPMQCKQAFSHPQLLPEIVALQLNRQIHAFPQGLHMGYFRANGIKTLSDFSKHFEMRHKKLEDVFLKHLHFGDKSSSQLELVKWNLARLQKLRRQEEKKIRKATEMHQIAPEFVPIKDLLNQSQWRELLIGLKWSNRERLGLIGELIAGLEVNKPEMIEMHPREYFDKTDIALMERNGLWDKLRNYEIDILADKTRHWVEVKYLTEGFRQQGEWLSKMKEKIKIIDTALAILSKEKKEDFRFSLLVYGPEKLNPEIIELVEGLKHTSIRTRPHYLKKLENY